MSKRLQVPFKHLRAQYAAHGRPIGLTLIWESGSNLAVQAEMHDVGVRKEVGTLRFQEVHGEEKGEVVERPPIPADSTYDVYKLSITENALDIEAGIMLRPRVGEPLLLIPGDYPYTLAMRCGGWHFGSAPEYPLDAYRAVKLDI